MDHYEKLTIEITEHYKKLASVCGTSIYAGSLDVDGRLHKAIWNTFDYMLKQLDPTGWLEWWIYENGCGKKAMKAGFDDKLTAIRTPKQLAKLIRLSHQRQ